MPAARNLSREKSQPGKIPAARNLSRRNLSNEKSSQLPFQKRGGLFENRLDLGNSAYFSSQQTHLEKYGTRRSLVAEFRGMPGISRRKVLAGAAAFLGGIVTAARRVVAQRMAPMPGTPEAIEAPWLLQGRSPSELGKRSRFVQFTRRIDQPLPSSDSMTPLHLLDGVITPADLHFERHHAGIPDIDPSRYKLVIHGLVDRPMVFTLADLQRLPQWSRIMFVECSGNGFRGYRQRDLRPDQTPQQIDGLTSTSEWTGVPLAMLFREVGVKASATWFLAEGMDVSTFPRAS